MKIKILLIPLLIIAIATFSIWLVYPTYSNGADGVKENYAKLKSEQKKLIELQNKSENVNSLSAQFSSLLEKDALYAFVPKNAKEEEIINSLSSLSSASGLLLFDSKINQPNKDKSIESSEELQTVNKEEKSLPEIQNFKVEMKLAGSYDKIKDFLINVGKFSRSNNFDILEISRNVSNEVETVSSDVLSVNIALDFNVLKEAKLNESNIGSSIFSNPKLESKIITEIKNQRNANIFQLNVDPKGKSNLFQM
ncbi:MAG: hypothetical protein Q7U36_02675 [bacterium]|nr:hypothetical protein [bacterium]